MRDHTPGSVEAHRAPVMVDGRYEIVSRLGEGGQAAVFGVLDRRLGVARALKALLPELARRPKLRTRFESEARTMASLEHPNIVRVFDVSATGRTVWFIMEHLPGGNLSERVDRGGPLPPALAVRTLVQLCAGVSAAHEKGIVHRDIKPQNVLIARDGTVKLVDFGIARTAEGHRTKAHAALGTLGFVSPEQLMDARAVDGRADVYSLGVTLFVLVTAADPNEWLRRRRHDRLPEILRGVIERATREDPAERHPTVGALASELTACLPLLPPDPPGTTLEGARVLARPVEDAATFAEVASWFDGSEPGDAPRVANAAPRAEATNWMTPGPASAREERDSPEWLMPDPDGAPTPLATGFEITLESEEREASEEARTRRLVQTNSIEAAFRPTGSTGQGDLRSGIALRAIGLVAALGLVVMLFLGGAAVGVHQWRVSQQDDVWRVQATMALQRELEAQRETATELVSRGADADRLDALYRAFAEAGDHLARVRAAELIDEELHREADRVMVEGTADAARIESALRALDRALEAYRESHPELR